MANDALSLIIIMLFVQAMPCILNYICDLRYYDDVRLAADLLCVSEVNKGQSRDW